MMHEELESLATIYAVGALDGVALAEFEAHLAARCARCEAAVRDHAETLAALAVADVRRIPPPETRALLLRRLEATAPPRADTRRAWLRWAVATAVAMIVAAAVTGMYVAARYEAGIGHMARDTAAMRERLRASEAMLHEQVARYAGIAELLRDPATRVVGLHGLGASSGAIGRVVWNQGTGGLVFVGNLPAAPPGKTYEMWTIAGGTPRPAGTFDVDATGTAAHRVAAPAGGPPVEVFAVTLESAGGVQAPSGPMVLASN